MPGQHHLGPPERQLDCQHHMGSTMGQHHRVSQKHQLRYFRQRDDRWAGALSCRRKHWTCAAVVNRGIRRKPPRTRRTARTANLHWPTTRGRTKTIVGARPEPRARLDSRWGMYTIRRQEPLRAESHTPTAARPRSHFLCCGERLLPPPPTTTATRDSRRRDG